LEGCLSCGEVRADARGLRGLLVVVELGLDAAAAAFSSRWMKPSFCLNTSLGWSVTVMSRPAKWTLTPVRGCWL